MKRWLGIILCILICGCNPDKSKKVESEEVSFSIDDSSLLFFRNTRSLSYEKQELENANLEIYLHQDWNDIKGNYLLPKIVVNWLHDEAYLLLEPNFALSDTATFFFESDTIHYINPNKEKMLKLAALLYEGIQEGNEMTLAYDQEHRQPFLRNKKARETFRITMQDYFRLTRRY